MAFTTGAPDALSLAEVGRGGFKAYRRKPSI
jgi:hypothetical protein